MTAVREKSCRGKRFVVDFTFGTTQVFDGIYSLDDAFLRCISLHCYAVITVIFRYYAVTMHDVVNHSMG